MFILRRSHLLAVVAVGALVACGPAYTEDPSSKAKEEQESLKSDSQQPNIKKVSQAFGHFIGRNLNSPGIKFDLESIIQGMRDGASGKPSPMSDEDYEKAMAALQEQAFTYLAEENLKAANSFLTNNEKAEGVIVLEPGKLHYMIIEKGTGPAVTEHATPLINYTGRYLDGTVFGSSAELGGPIPVPLDQTIQGFSKGIVGMKEGEKRRLYVHPDLGYGKTGQLPPNTLLIFEVEAVKATAPEKENIETSDASTPNYGYNHYKDDLSEYDDDADDDS